MKIYREPFVRHLIDTGRLNLRNGPFLYVWPTLDSEHPDGVVEIARKYIPDPPSSDDLAEALAEAVIVPLRFIFGSRP